jgi:hypothetical protein
MKKHLVGCFRFKRAISTEQLDKLCVTSEPAPNTDNLQRTITDSMGHALKKLTTSEMDQLAGMALFAGARPFTTFESIEMKEFHKALQANPTYKIPSRQQFAESVLDNCYTHVQKQVNQLLDKSQYLNVSVDETTDIRKRRIMNISVTDGKRSFCIALQALNDEKLNAESITNWIVERVRSNQAYIYTYY